MPDANGKRIMHKKNKEIPVHGCAAVVDGKSVRFGIHGEIEFLSVLNEKAVLTEYVSG